MKQLERKALQLRIEVLKMIYEAGSGHIGGSLSSLDILVILFYEVMRFDPHRPFWEERDRFILSKGHSVEAYYAVLADLGFFPREELRNYCRFGSRLTGHPTTKVPGVEVNTGSLGHGLAVGAGMAMAGKMDQKGYKVYVLMGDGELGEGSVWEAAQIAAHYKLDNLIGIVDRNRLQISGCTEDILRLEDLMNKWSAFGWEVLNVDGHNFEELLKIFKAVPLTKNKPHVIIAHTTKGKGISFMENDRSWHHRVPSKEELEKALGELSTKLREFEENE
ncbi:transketolase [Atrimonas thermophila]|jgi:transketolase|uniref:transketolase n=1 Tax=Atrimonas thermophila TaxID=3064161 RepID=UPI00399D262B